MLDPQVLTNRTFLTAALAGFISFFGIIGIASAEKSSALVTLTIGGIVATVIIILNVSSELGKHRKVTESKEDKDQLSELV